jgi:aerobic-type carbon monoxide dehydrogenase small subunit (CoxS/CutS family)
LLDEQAGQCGYCLPGIVISAKALLDRNPPTLVRPNQRRYETSRLSGVRCVPAI